MLGKKVMKCILLVLIFVGLQAQDDVDISVNEKKYDVKTINEISSDVYKSDRQVGVPFKLITKAIDISIEIWDEALVKKGITSIDEKRRIIIENTGEFYIRENGKYILIYYVLNSGSLFGHSCGQQELIYEKESKTIISIRVGP